VVSETLTCPLKGEGFLIEGGGGEGALLQQKRTIAGPREELTKCTVELTDSIGCFGETRGRKVS